MPLRHERLLNRLPWPLPAVLAWSAGWAVAIAVHGAHPRSGLALALGTAAAVLVAMINAEPWRRVFAAAGFPLSALALLSLGDRLSAAAWLAALVPVAAMYPLRAWRDAPFFPTPAAALRELPRTVQPPPRRVLDAGCGLGHGLAVLQRLWPDASLHGVEWSAPMAWLARRRVSAARVERADMWASDWSGFDLVYLFQRPESMQRAWHKAQAEMAPGSWLVSLEFEVPGVRAAARLDAGRGRALLVYRVRCAAAVAAAPRSTDAAPGR